MSERPEYVAFIDFVDQHDADTCGGEIARVPLRSGESGKRFECDVCGDAFVLSLEGVALFSRLRELDQKGVAND